MNPGNLPIIIYGENNNFSEWTSLNDTIMGGKSTSNLRLSNQSLIIEGEIIEEGGGFISCRSPFMNPPLDLSIYKGLELTVDGKGRTLKLALSCESKVNKVMENLLGINSLRWIAEVPTSISNTTTIRIPFISLIPVRRTDRVNLPFSINLRKITQIQILYSKFGSPGSLNSGFKSGNFVITIKSISGYF